GLFYRLPQPRVTRRREQMLGGREWFRSAFYNEALRPYGLAEGTISRFPLAGGWVFFTSIVHPVGTRPGPRQSRIIHLTLTEVESLFGSALATAADAAASALPPRPRQV